MEKANGVIDGSPKANGTVISINGHATSPKRKTSPKQQQQRSFLSWSFGILARLLTWYSIISVLFRCPATLEQCTEASPRICKPYFQLKHAVAPHLEPYYNTYAAPYVEVARPYYDTVDQRVLTPSWGYATKYGGPRIAQAQAFGQTQWEKNVQPGLTKYQLLAKAKYDQSLAPHVDQVVVAVTPYYEIAKSNAQQTYNDLLVPSYAFVEPYVQRGYSTASVFATEAAIPSAAWAWNKTYFFLDSTVWPHLRFVYTENVEPQLVKIGQRLGKYNVNNTLKATDSLTTAAVKAASTITELTSTTISATATPATTSAAASSSIEPSSSDAAPASSEDAVVHTESLAAKFKDEEILTDETNGQKTTEETVADDLKAWQEKYARALDEGRAEIEDRIAEISKHMIDVEAHQNGHLLVKQLEESVDAQVHILKDEIRKIIKDSNSDTDDPENALEQINAAVRKAGLVIKEKSQDVRNWAENYETELQATITAVATHHFKILESIRDLALQKIGMKWAWMDGVTYKDWAKYHQLKDRFNEWEDELKEAITSHPGLQAAEDEGRAVEGQAMRIAQNAAQELSVLKQVAGWKLAVQDDSDNFDPESTSRTFEEAKTKVEPELKPRVEARTEIPVTETIISEDAGLLSSVAPGQNPGEASDIPDLASTIALEQTPDLIKQTPETTKSADPAPVQLPVDEIPESSDENVTPVHVDSPLDEGEALLEGQTPAAADDDVDNVHHFDEEPHSSETVASVRSAFLGAAAQSVPSRQPILDDENDDNSFEAIGSVIAALQSDVPATITSAASSAYSAAMSAAGERYSQALSLASAQISGTPKPAHEELLSSVSSAYGNAVAAASSRLDAAIGAATGVFSTSTPTTNILPSLPTFAGWDRVESIAAQRLSEGQAWAQEQYESAKVAIGLATPTPTDLSGSASSIASVAGESLSAVTAAAAVNAEALLQNAQHNYYAGLGLAQVRYSEFLAAASSALSSVTATPTPTDLAGSVSSAASVASESASSVAGAGYDNIASAAGVAGTYASESWNAVLDELSARIYGQPTPTAWYSSFYTAAGDYIVSATDIVGSGAEAVTSVVSSNAAVVTDAAESYAAAASEKAAEQYVIVSSILSELLVGKEPTFSESVYSRLAGAYSVAASSVGDFASAASATGSSLASDATEVVKHATQSVKDEL